MAIISIKNIKVGAIKMILNPTSVVETLSLEQLRL